MTSKDLSGSGPIKPRHCTTEYRRGARDFEKGISMDACPYPKGDIRSRRWLDGFLAARTNKRLKEVFDKYPDTAFPV